MYTFRPADSIYAIVSSDSTLLCNLKLRGIQTWDELVAVVRSQLPGYAGVTRMHVRNPVGGWTLNTTMAL